MPGGKRKGAGRPKVGKGSQVQSISLPAELWPILFDLGEGSASAGVRAAVDIVIDRQARSKRARRAARKG